MKQFQSPFAGLRALEELDELSGVAATELSGDDYWRN